MPTPWNFWFRDVYGEPLPNNLMDSNVRLIEWIYNYIEGVYLEAINASKIYDDVQQGLDNTPSGDYFFTIDPLNNAFLILWKNNAGSPEQISSYPSYETLQDAVSRLQQVFSTEGTIESVNWDTVITPGLYKSLVAGDAPNGPGSPQLFYILNFKHEDGVLLQVALPYNASLNGQAIKYRTLLSSTWSNWRIILSNNAFDLIQTSVNITLQPFELCVPTAQGLTLILPQQPKENDIVAVSPLGVDTIIDPGSTWMIKGLPVGEQLRLDISNRIIEFRFAFNSWYIQ